MRVGEWLRRLALIPVVAIASYLLMGALPFNLGDDAKHQLPPELLASYRHDLGIGEPLGFLRPWEKLFQGERLGTSAQGVTGEELIEKLGGSLAVGGVALALALVWAALFAALRVRLSGTRAWALGELVPAFALGTPVFIPALLFAPYVVERGHFLPELAAALVVSLWPGIYLGTLIAGTVRDEQARDYVRTARAKGLSARSLLAKHVMPNVLPALLDSLAPVATSVLAGSFAAEHVLGLPYFGELYVLAVLEKQVAVVVVATTIFSALLVLVGAALAAVRLRVDPRAAEVAR
jgi:oligopeptide transport system permease protein